MKAARTHPEKVGWIQRRTVDLSEFVWKKRIVAEMADWNPTWTVGLYEPV